MINLIALFPILLVLILSASVYDNIRLFLFVIPLFSIIASFSLYQLLKTFNENFKNKISVFINNKDLREKMGKQSYKIVSSKFSSILIFDDNKEPVRADDNNFRVAPIGILSPIP